MPITNRKKIERISSGAYGDALKAFIRLCKYSGITVRGPYGWPNSGENDRLYYLSFPEIHALKVMTITITPENIIVYYGDETRLFVVFKKDGGRSLAIKKLLNIICATYEPMIVALTKLN